MGYKYTRNVKVVYYSYNLTASVVSGAGQLKRAHLLVIGGHSEGVQGFNPIGKFWETCDYFGDRRTDSQSK